MGIYLCCGRESAAGTATRCGMDDPGFQPHWWQDKHCQSTFSRIHVFTQCMNITKFSDVAFYARDVS